jgi:phospholipase C
MSVNRRDFLRSVASISGATIASAVALGQTKQIEQLDAALPNPEQSGIEHVVVVMMENRSFDHLLGWMPNANGRQAGLSYLDNSGTAHATYRLTDFVGCAHPDPDHSFAGGRSEYDAGNLRHLLREMRRTKSQILPTRWI